KRNLADPKMSTPAKARMSQDRSRHASVWRLLRGVVIVVVLTAATIGAAVWWEDRPVREIERVLDHREFEQALRLANVYLAQYPEHSDVLDQKARALAGLGRWSEAGVIFDRLGAGSPASQRAWSQVLLHQERWSNALPLLRRLNERSADDPDLLHELSACEAKLGHFNESIAAAEHLIRLPGHENRGRLLLGMLHFKRGNNRLAIQAWRPMLDGNPEAADLQVTPAEFFAALGRAMLDDGNAAEARPYLERSVRLDPTPDARNALAEACEQLGDTAEAIVLWREVIAGSPQDRVAREGLAQAALEKRDAVEARLWLEPLLARNELKSSTAYLMQRAALLTGENDEATRWDERARALRKREKKMNALDQALRESPQSFWSRAVRAHRFASEGNAREALLLAQELLRQQPDQPFVRQLCDALQNHAPLPSLDLIPYEQF
ncbi:MAG: tetratricopeptide repeat protein, partial [Deltaproteobacteria bacterium]